MPHYSIAITSDTVCPWCYVGLRRLQSAISQYQTTSPSSTFSISWHPYQLVPSAPTPGVDKAAHYAAKFGVQRTQMIQKHLGSIAAPLGIEFGWGGRMGNTLLSHRLIALARKTGGDEMQNKVVEEVFESYFVDNEDVSLREVLVERAGRAGMDREVVEQYLQSEEGKEEVEREVDEAKTKRFVSGVPDFIINGRYEVQGAEEPETFLGVFERIEKEGGGGGVVRGGETC